MPYKDFRRKNKPGVQRLDGVEGAIEILEGWRDPLEALSDEINTREKPDVEVASPVDSNADRSGVGPRILGSTVNRLALALVEPTTVSARPNGLLSVANGGIHILPGVISVHPVNA